MNKKPFFFLLLLLSIVSAQVEDLFIENDDTMGISVSAVQDQNNDNGEEEVEIPPRRIFTVLGLGPAGLGNLDSDNLALSAYYGYTLAINPFVTGKIIYEINTDFTDALVTEIGVGADILLAEGFFAPYFGVGVGGGFVRGAQDNLFGVILNATAGVLPLRFENIQLDIHAKVSVLLRDAEKGNPYAYSLRAGVYF